MELMIEKAGHDQVLEVNAQDVSENAGKEVMALVHRLTRARIQPLQLDILRSDGRHRLHLVALPACQLTLCVIEADQINGLSNGRQIWVTTGLMQFVRSDDWSAGCWLMRSPTMCWAMLKNQNCGPC